ncbi:threonine/serine exporter family protein [Sporosarcina thermotolerans]|uniref:Threonine/serine exporter family protein n=1 Tax=Sporosarcina thermotolerans TaxID=633404 RepID=A0AAW9AHN8_9BACL|nr:threonine/serine exporter family protein [Sporosarcina thermotolerans]MDW0118743.1 threonine/serine exporter family protein [Sporosarcina thermotolerans]WHT48423.1 threonine/serine exporter family protein [Sporosarcina thermotolerans]
MGWLVQAILSFLAAAGFGIIFNAPRKMLAYCGFVGMAGWMVYSVFNVLWGDLIKASFLGAFVVALVAHIFAKRFRTPMIIFSVAGIIPLVPGGTAYNAMRHFVENDHLTAISFATRALMVSGAIAMGLVFAEVIIQLFFRSRMKKKGVQ